MRALPFVITALLFASSPVVLTQQVLAQDLAQENVEDGGPLAPCVHSSKVVAQEAAATSPDPNAPPWGVELASAFSEKEALDEFGQIQKAHSNLLGSYSPMVVATCELNLGQDLTYSVRIGMPTLDAANKFCNNLSSQGLACMVQKN